MRNCKRLREDIAYLNCRNNGIKLVLNMPFIIIMPSICHLGASSYSHPFTICPIRTIKSFFLWHEHRKEHLALSPEKPSIEGCIDKEDLPEKLGENLETQRDGHARTVSSMFSL